jgi:hypothetical protein
MRFSLESIILTSTTCWRWCTFCKKGTLPFLKNDIVFLFLSNACFRERAYFLHYNHSEGRPDVWTTPALKVKSQVDAYNVNVNSSEMGIDWGLKALKLCSPSGWVFEFFAGACSVTRAAMLMGKSSVLLEVDPLQVAAMKVNLTVIFF